MKSTALLACEKIIIEKEGTHSIINVMLRLNVSLEQQASSECEESMPIPAKAVLPSQWWIYTVWVPSADNIGETFEQVYQLFWPNGEKYAETRLQPFTQNDESPQQTTFFFIGLPIGQEGRMRIVTWLDSNGHCVTEICETFLEIRHGIPDHLKSNISGLINVGALHS